MAQELLTNAKKHAGASRVEVVLEQRGVAFVLRVTDDGIGFSPGDQATPRPGHLGLATIREHAEMAGGRCQIESGPGRGTTVEVEVPA